MRSLIATARVGSGPVAVLRAPHHQVPFQVPFVSAVTGADVVVHAASDARRPQKTDINGTRRLLEALHRDPPRHLLYVSIVGVDRHPFRYYRAKRQAEQMVEASGIPFTVFRATQFHDLLYSYLVRPLSRLPVAPIPRGFRFQVVDAGDVATRITDLVAADPAGYAPDMGGPAVRTLEDLFATYAERAGRRPPRLLRVPVPGKAARAFRQGWHLGPEHRDGTVTWEQFLDHRLGGP